MSKELLIATYETKRMLVLTSFVNSPRLILPALAYAYEKRLAPILHEEIAREKYGLDPFDEIYPVKAEFMHRLLKDVDEKWLAKDFASLAFNEIEDRFGGYKVNRLEIAHTLRYAFLSGSFEDDVWTAIKKNAPSEAYSINRKFEPEDISFE